MSAAVIDEIVEQAQAMSDTDRNELIRRLNKISLEISDEENLKPKTNGKKGYVSPNTIWMRDNSHLYKGQYVAIKDGKFVASGRTIKDADQAARAKGVERPLLAYVMADGEEAFYGG